MYLHNYMPEGEGGYINKTRTHPYYSNVTLSIVVYRNACNYQGITKL